MEKFGPHDVITGGEIHATLVVLALAAVAFIWMAYGTRNRAATPTADEGGTATPKSK